MQIKLSSHAHVDITDGIRNHVRDRADHLVRIFDGISTLHVTFDVQKQHRMAEFVANVSHGAPVVAKAAAASLHAAIDLAAEKIEAQLRRHKEKVRDHRPHEPEGAPAPSAAPDEQGNRDGEAPEGEDEADTSGRAPASS